MAARLGLSVSEFYNISPIELYYAIKSVNEIKEQKFKDDWARMRMQTVYLINVQLSKKDRFKDPKKMMPFEWEDKEEPEEVVIPTEDQWKAINEKYKNV